MGETFGHTLPIKKDILSTWKDFQHHQSSGKIKLKSQQNTPIRALEWVKLKDWKCQELERMWSGWNSYTRLVGKANCSSCLRSLVVSHKLKLTLPMWPSKPIPRWEIHANVRLHKNSHSQVCSSLFNHSQRAETSQKMRRVEWISRLYSIKSTKYSWGKQRSDNVSNNTDKAQKHHAKPKSLHEKITHTMAAVTRHPRKGKVPWQKSRSQRCWGKRSISSPRGVNNCIQGSKSAL